MPNDTEPANRTPVAPKPPDTGLAPAKAPWIVRIKRRRDGKKYYFRHDCCTTARKESSMRLSEDVAKQLADAIARQHKDFTAWATPYASKSKKHRRATLKAAREADAMRIEEFQVGYKMVPEKKEVSDAGAHA